MARLSKKSLIGQIAANAENDQVIVTITGSKGKLLLPIQGKVSVKGDYAFVSLPATEGLYQKDANGNLSATGASPEVESAFFPERAEELKKQAEEIAQMKELARKHGFSLSAPEGGTVKRTRAPRGSRVVKPPKPMPKKGDKFVSTQNGIGYTITAVDGKKLSMKGEDGSTKEVTYSGIFWRWHNPA